MGRRRMSVIHLSDKVELGSSRVTLDNGFLKVRAKLSRTGIQEYLAAELGLTDRPPNTVIRVWRPDEEVFKPESMASFAGKPVTDNHPANGVTKDNAKSLMRGWSGEKVDQEGIFTAADLIIADAGLIAKVEAGKVEISNGYGCELELRSGTTPGGETFDAIQRNIFGNHIAVVDAGRCGADCRIQDHAAPVVADCGCGGHQQAPKQKEGRVADIKKITVDGLPIDATDQSEAIIRKLEGTVAELTGKLTAADAKATTAEAGAAERVAKLEAELATTKAQIPTGDALDKLVAARTQLLADAKRLAPAADFTGKTDAEVRQIATTAKLGDAAVAGKEPAFFVHAFDMLLVQNPAQGGNGGGARDPILDASLSTVSHQQANMSDADAAYAEMRAEQEKAWQS